jgi:hypothetical protein
MVLVMTLLSRKKLFLKLGLNGGADHAKPDWGSSADFSIPRRLHHSPSKHRLTSISDYPHNGFCSDYWSRCWCCGFSGEYNNPYFGMIELTCLQGRAGLVAYRRSAGGINAAGKAFYKGFVDNSPQKWYTGCQLMA